VNLLSKRIKVEIIHESKNIDWYILRGNSWFVA
jgi:hypothetical protein